jgi:hypothetical protein
LLEQIAGLREANEDLRASAVRRQQLYENAIRRCAERDNEFMDGPPDDATRD